MDAVDHIITDGKPCTALACLPLCHQSPERQLGYRRAPEPVLMHPPVYVPRHGDTGLRVASDVRGSGSLDLGACYTVSPSSPPLARFLRTLVPRSANRKTLFCVPTGRCGAVCFDFGLFTRSECPAWALALRPWVMSGTGRHEHEPGMRDVFRLGLTSPRASCDSSKPLSAPCPLELIAVSHHLRLSAQSTGTTQQLQYVA